MKWLIRYYKIYFRVLFFVAPRFAANKALEVFSTPINHKLRDREKTFLKEAEEEILEIDACKITVYKWGKGSKKALLVHGWEGNGGSLGAIGKLLVKNGFTVYAFDGPAHGKSSGKQTNVIAFSNTVSTLIRKYGIYDVVATHSFGSATSIYALAHSPDIVIEKMILLTSPNKLSDVIKEFAHALAFRNSYINHMYNAINHKYNVSIDSLNIEDLTLKTSVKQYYLLHDIKDRIIPFEYSEAIAFKNNKIQLIPLKGTGHYRMLWDEKTLKIISSIIKAT